METKPVKIRGIKKRDGGRNMRTLWITNTNRVL